MIPVEHWTFIFYPATQFIDMPNVKRPQTLMRRIVKYFVTLAKGQKYSCFKIVIL